MSQSERLVGTGRRTVVKVLRSSVSSAAATAIVNLAILPRVLHGIHAGGYGAWATLAAILAIGQLTQSGTGTEIARRVAAAHGDGAVIRSAVHQGVTVLTGIALAVETAAIVGARPIVDLIFTRLPGSERGQLVLLLIGIVTLFGIGLVGNGFFAALVGLQRSDFALWSGVAATVAGAVTTVAGIAAGLGLWALFLADCVQLIIGWIGPIIGIRKLLPHIGFRLSSVSWSTITGFAGMPALLVMAQASDLFDSQVDKLVLTHNVGPSSSAMFQVGATLAQGVAALSVIPLSVMLAGTAELHRTNPQRLRRLEVLTGSATQAIAAISAGAAVLFGGPFVMAWLGRGYAGAALAVRVLAVAALLNLWSAPWYYYAIGRRRYHYVPLAAGATLVVNLVATVLLTTHIGLKGALIGSVAGSAAGTATARLLVSRWERGPWLKSALRATGLIALLVVPLLLAGLSPAASWPYLILLGTAYLTVSIVLLLVCQALPFKLVASNRGIHLSLAWQDAKEDSRPQRLGTLIR